ncbi:hypothetical protein [Nocardiopsis dassonvillei]|uniref:hypothetical protein n=1 Tax=Nocardiopsis dassonvillei TaxID=2014 RepID=UPI00363B93B8
MRDGYLQGAGDGGEGGSAVPGDGSGREPGDGAGDDGLVEPLTAPEVVRVRHVT